jgi:hypothetical protein
LRAALTDLRRLLLGDTWDVPVGLALAIALTIGVRSLGAEGGWFEHAGGFLLLALVLAVLAASLRRR